MKKIEKNLHEKKTREKPIFSRTISCERCTRLFRAFQILISIAMFSRDQRREITIRIGKSAREEGRGGRRKSVRVSWKRFSLLYDLMRSALMIGSTKWTVNTSVSSPAGKVNLNIVPANKGRGEHNENAKMTETLHLMTNDEEDEGERESKETAATNVAEVPFSAVCAVLWRWLLPPSRKVGSHRIKSPIYIRIPDCARRNCAPSSDKRREKESKHRAKDIRARAANYLLITISCCRSSRPPSHGYCARHVIYDYYRPFFFSSW